MRGRMSDGQCPRCARELPAEAYFCRRCGLSVRPRVVRRVALPAAPARAKGRGWVALAAVIVAWVVVSNLAHRPTTSTPNGVSAPYYGGIPSGSSEPLRMETDQYGRTVVKVRDPNAPGGWRTQVQDTPPTTIQPYTPPPPGGRGPK